MRQKLQKFEVFAQSLLPHEVGYLLRVQQFQDEDNLDILRRIHHNCHPLHTPQEFDPDLDKRKYSNLKKWIQTRLDSIDVDLQLTRLLELEALITTETLSPETEETLLREMGQQSAGMFYFGKYYEVMRLLRNYLIAHQRYEAHDQVQRWLEAQAGAYSQVVEVQELLYETSRLLAQPLFPHDVRIEAQEARLRKLFYDESPDGHSRYQAFERLAGIYIQAGSYARLRELFDALDGLFQQGQLYTRRILASYYGNRSVLHNRLGEVQDAEIYGYLAIRHPSADYLQHINNLAALLLHKGEAARALALMQDAVPEMRRSQDMHSKTGFVAFYMRSLYDNGRAPQAEQYGAVFLRSYKDLPDPQRFVFFTVYLQVLIHRQKYALVVSLARRYKLADLDATYRPYPIYLPAMHWYVLTARYQEGRLSRERLAETIARDRETLANDHHKQHLIAQLVEELYQHAPQVFGPLRQSTPGSTTTTSSQSTD